MTESLINSMNRPFRSMGVKLVVVCFLALVMTIPALFVWGLIDDRSRRADEVVAEVGRVVGGPQTFLGPVLAIPFTVPATIAKAAERGVYVVFPASGDAMVNTKTEVRHRSLFRVPVYRSDIAFKASFDLTGVPVNAPVGAMLDWSRAEFLVGATDARGAQSDISLTADGKSATLTPANTLQSSEIKLEQGGATQLTFFGAAAREVAHPDARFDVDATMKFTGAQRLAVLAFGKTTTITLKGDWPHPSFEGGLLSGTQSVSDQGFTATWSVPFIARGVPAEDVSDVIGRLGHTAVGVSFVALADPYQSTTRSLKYAVLFVGLVFLSYFLFEVTSGQRVHPAQYILVGVAQMVFYLLLLSLAERVGFDIGFLIAAVATVSLISAYAGWIFHGRRYGLRALAAFSALYALIYVLLRLEDEALLVGALASFGAVAAVMYFTRKMDWYASTVLREGESVGGA
ncbi:MAG: cell envelope integrity protein CreD [Candidatus Korobacteraceae bacterium]